MRVILTGGGTGGHLYPGISIVEALQKRMECDVTFIGTRHGIEHRVIPEIGYDFKTIWMAGMHRGTILRNLLFPLKMAVSLVQCLGYLMRLRPDVVIATGGYVSWPVMTAAWWLRKPRFIQEQNQKPGLVTRLLAGHMDRVFLSFDASRIFFKRQDHLVVTGNPTRGNMNQPDKSEAYHLFELKPEGTTLFVFGGSQGALGLNRQVMAEVEIWLENTSLQILWATGPRWIDGIRATIRNDRIKLLPYIHNMAAAYAVSDLILCRSGAGAVAEITRLGKAAVFVPFPGAANNHQEANARALADAEAAELVLESEFITGKLSETILGLIHNVKKRQRLAQNAGSFGRPEAAETIADKIIRHVLSGPAKETPGKGCV